MKRNGNGKVEMNKWKMMMNHEAVTKKENKKKLQRFLVNVSFIGSTGPIRFVVNEDDEVSSVIDTALRAYAREGRFPVLGSATDNFLLYHTNAGYDALSPHEKIGSINGRDFLLCKKESQRREGEAGRREMKARRGHGFRAWLLKSLSF